MTTGVKGINLIPDEIRLGWRIRRIRGVFIAAAVVYVGVIASVYLRDRRAMTAVMLEGAGLTAEREAGMAKVAGYTELATRLGTVQKAEAELKKRLVAAGSIGGRRVSWAALLRRLSHDIPKDIRLDTITTADSADREGKSIKFTGTSSSNAGIAAFVFVLENTGYCDNVALSYAQRRVETGMGVFAFEINARIRLSDEIAYE